jgi:23S rRNA (adenine2030-N6)-methyltransferase
MIRDLQTSGIRYILQIELAVQPDTAERGMTASGMIVINPPWKFEQQIRQLLPWLYKHLVPDNTGHYRVNWIVPE